MLPQDGSFGRPFYEKHPGKGHPNRKPKTKAHNRRGFVKNQFLKQTAKRQGLFFWKALPAQIKLDSGS
jgi:hypothetical protein